MDQPSIYENMIAFETNVNNHCKTYTKRCTLKKETNKNGKLKHAQVRSKENKIEE